ncbi:hypothetical protein TSAR_012283 [Trichomalopsis sarcophagae]|uniref:C2H2-type domain-containing protein n=1 Tax=Trichomalopsis sarcophagae TaxID=543379 RepID=A0A232FN56_9HYME|nr:hypothetical protein TSAR_012283 [Trichomalopsis sarcophagae]
MDSYNPLWSLQELKTEVVTVAATAPVPDYHRVPFDPAETLMDQQRGVQFVTIPAGKPQVQHKYDCLDCGKSYKWLDSLRRHQRVECGNKARKFICSLCDKKYKYRYEMKNHIESQHKGCEATAFVSDN